MSKAPAFQFYPKDWLSSPKVQLMTPAQEGAYVRLLCFCWNSGDCSLPDDDAELAILSRLGEGWFNGGSAVVRKCFMPHPAKPGFLTNERLLDEAAKQAAWQRKSAEGGRKSAANRAEKKGKSKGSSTKGQPDTTRAVEPNANSSSASSTAARDSGTEVPSSPPAPKTVKMPFHDIPDAWRRWAMTERGWDESIVDTVWSVFRDYWHTGKGKNTKREDWTATWRNWCLKENIKPKGQQHGRHAGFEQQDYLSGTEGFEVIGGSRGPA